MFCHKCGKQIEEDSQFCPYCGAKNTVESEVEKQDTPVKKKKGKRKKNKLLLFIIAVLVLMILGAVLFSGGNSSPSEEQLIALVQNGYLGSYDTVTIKEVLGYAYEDAEWNAGEAVSGGHYIIECKDDDITIQFSIAGLEEESFKVSGLKVAGMDGSNMKAYDWKLYLDSIYQRYSDAYSEKGLYIDTSIANNTLEGHIGPVRTAAESADATSTGGESMKDLALYADYTEDELIREFGYKKNEYGMYPEEMHVNFFFTDGSIYMISINRPEDTGMSLCGVNLQNSVEEADKILERKGFTCEGSFESVDFAKDGSSDTVNITVFSYVENTTGYPFYISVDADDKITSMSYTLEAEEPVYAEEISGSEEESWDFTAETLTYGAYSFDDGTGTTGTAEVGFYTDMDGDYIYIECWRNDRAIVYFTGILEAIGESYYAYCEEINTGIIVTFADDGLYVQIDESAFPDIDNMEGFYNLDRILNLDEVG